MARKNVIYYFNIKLILILLIFHTSCTKELVDINDVEFSYTGTEYKLAIQGSVLTIYDKQFIKLTKPVTINDTIKLKPISNAEIYLFDGNTYYPYYETEIPGEYLTVDSLIGVVGKCYTVKVKLDGKTYTATDSLKAIPDGFENLVPIYNIHSNEKGRIFFNAYIHNFGYTFPLYWIINYTSDSIDPDGIKVLNCAEILKYRLYLYNHVGSPPQGVFSNSSQGTGGAGEPDEMAEFIAISVSAEYYKYLVSRFNITLWSSGIFSTQPGNTCTNVSKGGTGFFFASEVKTIRIKYKDLKTLK